MSNRAQRRAAKHRPHMLESRDGSSVTDADLDHLKSKKPGPVKGKSVSASVPVKLAPLDKVAAAQEALEEARVNLDRAVIVALRGGASYAAVGRRLGISRQTVQQRYVGKIGARSMT